MERFAYEIAGILGGIDPRIYSLRNLLFMFDEHMKSSWDHTASICATIVNMNRDPKKSKPVSPVSLNPYRKGGAKEKPLVRLDKKNSMKILKQVFIDHKPVDLAALTAGKVSD